MWKTIRGVMTPLLTIAALALAPGCIFDPKPSVDPPVRPEIEWPDMTDRDDVIRALVLCYTYPSQSVSLVKYEGLLHTEYFFLMTDDDAAKFQVEPYIDRVADLTSTELIFESQTDLALDIPVEGSWLERLDIDGDPCENCWETLRTYYIRAQFGAENTIYVSPPERAFVTIVVAPDESDPSKWVIRAMYDLGI